jgi:Xaa-Pro dipeptidase
MTERHDIRGSSPAFIWFSRAEFGDRIARTRAELKRRRLAGLLVFAQESHYYLTGYDSVGYLFFQCAVLTANEGPITLLTRRPDLQQAKETSIIEDIRIWYNAEDANPAEDLKGILAEKGLKGERLGIELDTYGLTAANHARVRGALEGWCELVDASEIVRGLRVVKSPAEQEYVRQAAHLGDKAMLAMIAAAKPGDLDSKVTLAGFKEILEGGGDVAPAGPLVNSGRRALYGRSVCGPRQLESQDQITIEFAATYRRYNACLIRTVVVGQVKPNQQQMFDLCRTAIDAMTAAAQPGRPISDIDAAHRRVFDEAGHKVHRYSACGYSLGATYRPSWMDVPPMIFYGNRTPLEPGMILFPHAMFPNTDTGLAMSLGHTILITETGCEVLSRLPLELPSAP